MSDVDSVPSVSTFLAAWYSCRHVTHICHASASYAYSYQRIWSRCSVGSLNPPESGCSPEVCSGSSCLPMTRSIRGYKNHCASLRTRTKIRGVPSKGRSRGGDYQGKKAVGRTRRLSREGEEEEDQDLKDTNGIKVMKLFWLFLNIFWEYYYARRMRTSA